DVEVIPDGKTFFWAGEYGWDLNSRETLDTQLNVFAHFEPKLSQAARDCDVLFLANIQPALQLSVLDQCTGPRWTALDSMNLWIVVDPTGAGDTFAGGLVGYIASMPERDVEHDLLATAIAHGTAVASFNVEEFGTERVARLTHDEVRARVAELHRMTQFTNPT